MAKLTTTSLSNRRIYITLLMFLSIIPIRYFINSFTGSYTIANMFAFTVVSTMIIMYDWNLFALHYNRAKKDKITTLIYTIIGSLLIGGWLYLNTSFLHGFSFIPDFSVVLKYKFSIPCVLISYSFLQAAIFNIVFKVITDRFVVTHREILIILVSGFLGGLFLTVINVNINALSNLVSIYLYNVVLMMILSYLYNQTRSILPGILSMGFMYLVYMIIALI